MMFMDEAGFTTFWADDNSVIKCPFVFAVNANNPLRSIERRLGHAHSHSIVAGGLLEMS